MRARNTGIQTCRDEDCQRYACRIYREALRDGREAGAAEGYAAGQAAGFSEGHSAGYSEGFSDGLASCPGPHTGG